MNGEHTMPVGQDRLHRYEIRLLGQLDECWSDWFEGFILTSESDGITTLTGSVFDQAALHGLLRRVSNLGVRLVSVNAVRSGHS